MKTQDYNKVSRVNGLFRFVPLASITIAAVILAVAFPQTTAAKYPDEPGVICLDLRFEFPADQQHVAGRNIVVTARWFNERTGIPVVDEE